GVISVPAERGRHGCRSWVRPGGRRLPCSARFKGLVMTGQICPPVPLTLSLRACHALPQRGRQQQSSLRSSPGVEWNTAPRADVFIGGRGRRLGPASRRRWGVAMRGLIRRAVVAAGAAVVLLGPAAGPPRPPALRRQGGRSRRRPSPRAANGELLQPDVEDV